MIFAMPDPSSGLNLKNKTNKEDHSFLIEHTIDNGSWSDIIPSQTSLFNQLCYSCFELIKNQHQLPKESTFSIIYTNNAYIQTLNKKWRNIDKPTNVLSFPLYSSDEIKAHTYLEDPYIEWGDIFIADEYCRMEAKTANIPFEEHISHMVIHGLLHILGYDHITTEEAKIMEQHEIDILAKHNFSSPYDLNSA